MLLDGANRFVPSARGQRQHRHAAHHQNHGHTDHQHVRPGAAPQAFVQDQRGRTELEQEDESLLER